MISTPLNKWRGVSLGLWVQKGVAHGVGWWGDVRECFPREDTSELNLKGIIWIGGHFWSRGKTVILGEVNATKFQSTFLKCSPPGTITLEQSWQYVYMFFYVKGPESRYFRLCTCLFSFASMQICLLVTRKQPETKGKQF